MRYALTFAMLVLATIAGANPIAPVTIPVMPGRIADVTPSDSSSNNFAPSVIVCTNGTISAIPVLPDGASAVVWTTTQENFVVPGIYVRVNSTGTSATGCKRLQVDA